LEYLVKQTPTKKDYWGQLEGVYLNLAAQEKDERKAREYNIRAILAIERAQSLGYLKTPKDNFTLYGIYFNIGQFGRGTEILHAGLRDGSIENEIKNWEMLAYSYQQVDRPLQAIDALKEGSKKFPNSGQLDYSAAQIYYSINKPEESFKALENAVKKGHFEKPGAVYSFLGYVCWELGKFNEALDAIKKAQATPDGQKDQQLPKLRQAVEDAIRDREEATNKPKSL
jgi:tetratricopeptide (TPR) repeat protein